MLTCVGDGRVRQADSPRSRNAGEAISRIDFRPRVRVDRFATGVLSRVTEDVTSQRLVDAGAEGTSGRRVPGRSARGRYQHR